MTTSCKELSPHLQPFINLVESGELRTCKDIKALVRHVKKCFSEEEIYIDEELADRYMGLAKYFPFERIFEWQEFVITLHLCAFRKHDGMPRWPELFCMIGRGAGKDGLIAYESACLVSPYCGILKYDVDICANNEEQALRPVLDVVDAFENSKYREKLKKHYRWKTESVRGIKTRGTIRGRTNNPKGKDGMRSGEIVFNEIHQYKNYDNINVFMTGLGKVKHPRIGYFTTNGEEREGPLDDMIAAAEGILHEGFPDNGLLAFMCRLDALEEVHDPRNWEKANPSLPYFPSLKWEYEREYETWKANPQRLPAFIQKRMNLESSSSDTAVTDYKNIKATNREIPDLTGWSCVVGIDFSKITDWASVDFHFRQGDVRYDISHSWLCLQSKDIQRMKCPWKQWADDGRLTLVDDVEIKPEILTEYITEMRMKYLIRAIAIDDFRYALMARALKEIGFDAKVNKNLKLVRPSDIMRAATVIDSCFANQYLVWGDAPELRWATNNAKLIRHGRKAGSLDDADLGNLVYGKIEGKSRKTDPFMAFVASMTIEDRLPNIRTGERRRLSVVTY